uniref:Uncharacterized protein n=1 Tax=Phlebotomus papatasi TaxID=29031 RepID=A0A1B0EZ07_PHLPP
MNFSIFEGEISAISYAILICSIFFKVYDLVQYQTQAAVNPLELLLDVLRLQYYPNSSSATSYDLVYQILKVKCESFSRTRAQYQWNIMMISTG